MGWEGSPTKIDYSKKGSLILTSPLENLVSKRLAILAISFLVPGLLAFYVLLLETVLDAPFADFTYSSPCWSFFSNLLVLF